MRIPNNPSFRPPAEADSLILQIDEGCPWNRCTFCGMYKTVRYRQRPMNDVSALIQQESAQCSQAERTFLADGDVMHRSYDDLLAILVMLE
jgi:radical SAM superfamily enzyme YgiQ (UPF0313 family)